VLHYGRNLVLQRLSFTGVIAFCGMIETEEAEYPKLGIESPVISHYIKQQTRFSDYNLGEYFGYC